MHSELPPFLEPDNDTEGINISPLIDIVFILLLFFVVTSAFIDEAGLLIEKPTSSQARQLEPDSKIVQITANQELFLEDRRCALTSLRTLLESGRPQRVLIRADGAVTTQFLVRVMDEVKAAGVDEINLAAERTEP